MSGQEYYQRDARYGSEMKWKKKQKKNGFGSSSFSLILPLSVCVVCVYMCIGYKNYTHDYPPVQKTTTKTKWKWNHDLFWRVDSVSFLVSTQFQRFTFFTMGGWEGVSVYMCVYYIAWCFLLFPFYLRIYFFYFFKFLFVLGHMRCVCTFLSFLDPCNIYLNLLCFFLSISSSDSLFPPFISNFYHLSDPAYSDNRHSPPVAALSWSPHLILVIEIWFQITSFYTFLVISPFKKKLMLLFWAVWRLFAWRWAIVH